jgi:hypothetical protein
MNRDKTRPHLHRAILTLACILIAPAIHANAQTPSQDDLFKTVSALDTELFGAVNSCNLEKLSTMVADDLEFYHDLDGLMTGKQSFLDAVKNNLCNKVHRELVAGTLEVHPLKGYGAVEIGVHRFYHPNNPSDGVGEAKFIHIWQLKDGAWKLTRVISIDHHSAK